MTADESSPAISSGPRAVLVTGAAGRIGSSFVLQARGRYVFRLLIHGDDDPAAVENIRPTGTLVNCDLADLDGLKRACESMDTVVHLAGNPAPYATWEELLPTNIIGTYNVFVAARHAGCRRVIYASSIHAISGYPRDVQVKSNEPVNPGDLYGVSKCFGEAMGRYMAEQEHLSVICLRIGAWQPVGKDWSKVAVRMLDSFISDRDMNQLLDRCIDAAELQFAIFHALSNNPFKRMDISDARRLVGYDPQDDPTQHHPTLAAFNLSSAVQSHNQKVDGQKPGIRKQV